MRQDASSIIDIQFILNNDIFTNSHIIILWCTLRDILQLPVSNTNGILAAH